MLDMHEVTGSSPVSPTNIKAASRKDFRARFLVFLADLRVGSHKFAQDFNGCPSEPGPALWPRPVGRHHRQVQSPRGRRQSPRYVNQDFERLLAIGRSFRCATTLALQTTDQLVLVDKPAFSGIVISNCRNNYANERTLFFPWRHSSYTEREGKEQRFDYTALMGLPKFHAVSRIARDDAPQEPVLSSLDLSPWDKDRNRRRVRELRGSIRTDLPSGPASPGSSWSSQEQTNR